MFFRGWGWGGGGVGGGEVQQENALEDEYIALFYDKCPFSFDNFGIFSLSCLTQKSQKIIKQNLLTNLSARP